MPQLPAPKSLAELESQRMQFYVSLQVWREKAKTWAAKQGKDLPDDVSPEQFFGWLQTKEKAFREGHGGFFDGGRTSE